MDLLQFTKENPPPVGTLDKGGTPFDPGKHAARVNKNTLRWIPRSPGRYNKGQSRFPGVDAATAPGAPADAPASVPSGMPPVKEVSADALLDLPTVAPAPKGDAAPSPTPPPSASPALPEVGPQADATTAGPSAEAPRGGDAKASAAHAGKLAARATYAVTGALIRDHKAAKPAADEHTALANTWTAFFEFRGVAFVGVFAVGAAVLCYLLEDGRREPFVEFVKGLFSKKPEKRAEPSAAPVTTPNAKPAPDSAAAHHVVFPE